MDTSSYTEKRKNPRAQLEVPLRIKQTGPSLPIFNAKSVDLSEGGVKLSLEDNLQLPKNPILEFALPQALEDFRIYTEIIWNDGQHYGLRFKDLGRKQTTNLKRMLWKCENFIEKSIADLLNDAPPEIRGKIRSFFINDVRTYLDQISSLYVAMERQKLDKHVGQDRFDSQTNEIAKKGDRLEKLLDHKLLTKKIKHRFRFMVSSWVHDEGKLHKRSLEKPRGYPGDYLLLEKIYNNRPESDGIGFYHDKNFLRSSYACAVRKRKDKMVEILENFVKNANLPSIRILNLASGSCREIKELFERPIQSGRTVKITCIDHDDEALKYSQETLRDLPNNVQVDFIKENVLTMPEEKHYSESLGNQNLIYSLGLIDYVPDRILKNIIKFWYSLLASDGRLVLTHKDRDRDSQIPLASDWFCDWKFIPRNEEHFVNLVKDSIKDDYLLKLDRDVTGKIIFLTLDKKFESIQTMRRYSYADSNG